MTGLAFGQLGDFNLGRVAEHGLVQIQLELEAQIGAPELLRAGIAPTATGATEDVAEHIAKNIAEITRATAAAMLLIDTCVTILIIGRTFLIVG